MKCCAALTSNGTGTLYCILLQYEFIEILNEVRIQIIWKFVLKVSAQLVSLDGFVVVVVSIVMFTRLRTANDEFLGRFFWYLGQNRDDDDNFGYNTYIWHSLK